MINRRNFISKTASLSLAMPIWTHLFATGMQEIAARKSAATDPVTDAELWKMIRGLFEPSSKFINLENGYFSPQPMSTRNYQEQRNQYINKNTSWYMRKEQEEARELVRKKLATLAGATEKETVLVRNTTEAMNTIIMGYPWQKGDEVIYSNQDYGSMIEQLKQAEQRFGLVLKKVDLPLHPDSDGQLVDIYLRAATPKTRLILLTHLINLSGQILPAKEIIRAAHTRNIEVLVDAAHSFAHVNVNFKELDADYLGCSLHKWLCNPLGAGMLCIKPQHISKIWPLFGDTSQPKDSCKKFEHIGTQPSAVQESISQAIDFHHLIGPELKENRLRYLQQYWTEAVRPLPKITINTPKEKQRACALANISIQGFTPDELSKKFLDDYNIFTVAIDHPAIKGVRVTPHLYTSTEELDLFIKAIKEIAA
jgi:selenocysteine lyase/cysteine desulfurase